MILLILKILIKINWFIGDKVHKLLDKLDRKDYDEYIKYTTKMLELSDHTHIFISDGKKRKGV